MLVGVGGNHRFEPRVAAYGPRADPLQAGDPLERPALGEDLLAPWVAQGQELGYHRCDFLVPQALGRGHPSGAVQDVVAVPELVELDGRKRDPFLHQRLHAQIALIVGPSPATAAKVLVEAPRPANAADDARHVNGAQAQLVRGNQTCPCGVLGEASQGRLALGLAGGWMNEQHRDGRPADDLFGHAPHEQSGQPAPDIAAEDHQVGPLPLDLGDDRFGRRSKPNQGTSPDPRACQPGGQRLQVRPRLGLRRGHVFPGGGIGGEDVEERDLRLERARLGLGNRKFAIAQAIEVQWDQDALDRDHESSLPPRGAGPIQCNRGRGARRSDLET